MQGQQVDFLEVADGFLQTMMVAKGSKKETPTVKRVREAEESLAKAKLRIVALERIVHDLGKQVDELIIERDVKKMYMGRTVPQDVINLI